MKRALVPVLGGLLLLAPATAPSQTIRGVVVEDGTRMPIVGADVQLTTSSGRNVATAQTDSVGGFVLLPRRSGSFAVRLRHLSYVFADSVVVAVRPGEAIEIELRMGRTAIPLEPVVVTVRGNARLAGFYERMRQPGFGQFVTRADIEARRGTIRATDLLRAMPGIEIITVGLGGSDRDPPPPPGTPRETMPRVALITMHRAGGPCEPAIFIDRLEIRQFKDAGIDDFLKPEMLEGFEVYPRSAGAPVEFVEPNTCGVVAFWTRSATGEEEGKWSWKKLAAAAGSFLLMVTLTR